MGKKVTFFQNKLIFCQGKYNIQEKRDTEMQQEEKEMQTDCTLWSRWRQRWTHSNKRWHYICYHECSWTADGRHNNTVQQSWHQSVSITSIHCRTRRHTCTPVLRLKRQDSVGSRRVWMSGRRCGCAVSPKTWHSAADAHCTVLVMEKPTVRASRLHHCVLATAATASPRTFIRE